MSRLAELKKQQEFKAAVEDRLARGQMTVKNTGEQYTAEKATADHTTTELRMSGSTNGRRSIEWK